MEEAFHLYLASASPRRRELLQQAGLRFRLLAAGVDESRRAGEAPEDYVQRLALDKARAGLAQLPAADTHPVLGADTLVLCAGQVLGKPRDAAQARAMLSLLSGRSHSVLTAVALCRRGWQATALSRSTVSFRPLSPEEIAAYWTSGEPRDKAGAYAIQGRAALFVTALSGSYSGVMGLPLYETGQLLEQAGLALPTLLAEAAA